MQRAALKTPTPFGRTLSFPEPAVAPLRGVDSSPEANSGPLPQIPFSRRGSGSRGTPFGQACTADSGTNQKKTEPNTVFNKVILIGRLGQNAEAKTAQNNKEYVVLSVATQESWKNDKGEDETRTEWHRVYAWSHLSKFARTLQKGQLITLEGKLKYREVEEDVEGVTFNRRIAEIHAISMKRLSKIEDTDDPSDGEDDE
ncbi:single-stranded DNA-binding protein [Granulicella arctica]|uniref:single-stranded DNA-binding protein n=1 Tax=Granulicella arctica TaxID=940613 RepID=UPI0021E0FC44|nr:single-stranded DNA-binding protein [Granulicella arctica]